MRSTLLIALLTLATPALADEASDARKAKDLFAAGQKLYKADKYAEAIVKFEAAYTVTPHPVIYFNIARCYEQLGDAPKAIKAYKDYLRLMPSAKDREAVNESVAALERKVREKTLARVTVTAEPAGARVEVDGKAVAGTPAIAEVPPGTHQVLVSLEGHDSVERTVATTAGQAVDLTVTLRKTADPKGSASDAPRKDEPAAGASLTPGPSVAGQVSQPGVTEQPRKRVATWVVGGVAVAGLGTGIALGLMSSSATSAMRAPIVSPATYPTTAERDAQVKNITTLAVGADVAYGVAAAAAVTAVVLFFVEK